MPNPCAAPACTAPARAGQLMCLPCWKRLPRAIQRKVNETWRNVRSDSEAYREARAEAVQWHRDNPVSGQGGLF